ncbi:MAG: TspO/MBR family protein [Gemmatimonadaceae bacterium]
MRIGGYSTSSIAITVVSVVGLAVLGAWLTDTGQWYRELRKPWFQPPDFLFAPAWTTIFVCLGCAAVIAWNSPVITQRQRTAVLMAFGLNFVLNSAWSFLFFERRRPDLALFEVVVFWCSIVALIVVVRPLSTTAVWLLVPYLAWVSFATVLNQRIVALNAPFSQS